MKKIIVMMLMMIATVFASPLFSKNISPPGVKTFNSTNAGEYMYSENRVGQVGTAYADNLKVSVLHKDTLLYSWEANDNRINRETGKLGERDSRVLSPTDGMIAVVSFSLI